MARRARDWMRQAERDFLHPNGFPEGAPFEYFDREMAREAIDAAEAILRWCRDHLGG